MTTIIEFRGDGYDEAVELADAHLRSGGILIYPTDTVYGIGCDATNESAVAKVRRIKGVEANKPLSVMVAGLGMAEEYCETGIWEDMILKRFLPGPYTFILKESEGLPAAGGSGTIGIRIPDSEFCNALCARFGKPIVTTSANLTGKPAPKTCQEIDMAVMSAAGLAIDGGPAKHGTSSTVIDLVLRRMLRQGDKDWINLVDLPER